MKHPLYLSASLVLLFASSAHAATYYVSPTGVATEGCTRGTPCDLGAGVALATAGDTVILMDGVYDSPLYVNNTGTPDAWITFQADQCATPIIEGPGVGPTEMLQDSGVGSSVGEYLRFVGLVVRGWNIGFGNAWADGVESDAVSNGHWEIEHCISYSNGRTGFTFFSAEDFTLKHSISAHNGSSQVHSWSSGVTLFEASGNLLVDGNISFENTDAERATDGSGFIVDEESNGAVFVNNIAFGNAGSCLRLTDSSGTVFINNTCYRNSQFGSRATGPSNPSELYFTNAGVTVQNVTFMNNVIVGTGEAPAGQQAVVNQPMSGWTNNVVATGQVGYFVDPTGTNPSFLPAPGDMALVGTAQSGNDVPASDIGLDPKCIVRRTPVMVGQVAAESWWAYDVDIDYIQSIGGVAACFNPATRSNPADIGAYQAGAVTTVEPGSCVPPPEPEPEPEPIGGAGGVGGVGGGSSSAGGSGIGGSASGGSAGGGSAGGSSTGGVGGSSGAGAPSVPGTTTAETPAGGAPAVTPSAEPSTGPTATGAVPVPSVDAAQAGNGAVPTDEGLAAAPTTATTVPMATGSGGAAAVSSSETSSSPGGCGCRVVATTPPHGWLAAAWLCGVALPWLRRRASARKFASLKSR
jgi:parallel beta-helix repeat protein